jgi:hypothetical protein
MDFGKLALTALSSFAGSIVGNSARTLTQTWLQREQPTAAGEELESGQIVITGVISNMVAATTVATMLPKHNALYGFAIGLALSAATGDAVDRWIGEAIATAVDTAETASSLFDDESSIYDDDDESSFYDD